MADTIKPGSQTLKLPAKPKAQPAQLCYVPIEGRYLLHEQVNGRWRPVPLLTSESASVVLR